MTEASVIDRSAFASPVLEDMDHDGDLDIIQAAFDGGVYVFDIDGTLLDGWPVFPHYTGSFVPEPDTGRVFTTPAVADFNGDGYPELLVGSNEKLGQGGMTGAVYLLDGRGNNAPGGPYLPHWPVTITSFNLFPLVADGVPNSGVIGELDGTLAAVIHGNASSPFIMPADPGEQEALGTVPVDSLPKTVDPDTGKPRVGVAPTGRFGELSSARRPDVMFPLFANPSLGDIDQDGTLDVIAAGSSLTLAQSLVSNSNEPGQHLMAVWSGKTGDMLPGSPYRLEDYSFFNSQAVADLNGDDYPEILVASAGYFMHAYDGCGREPDRFPKFTGQWMIPTPAVGDIDGDGKLEVVTGTRNGWVYAWRTEGAVDGMVQWESYHHDNRNTGNYQVPLDQGDSSRQAAEPMTLEFCRSALATEGPAAPLEPTGGCAQCALATRPSDAHGRLALLLAGALGLAGGVRRRRRRCR